MPMRGECQDLWVGEFFLTFFFLAEVSLERVYGRVWTWFLGWFLVRNRSIIMPSLCVNCIAYRKNCNN